MDIATAERIAGAVDRITRCDRMLNLLNDYDAKGYQLLPGFLGGEVDGPFSAETCIKIRALMREDIAARREIAMRELSSLGVEPTS